MSSIATRLAAVLRTVRRPGDFFVAGRTELFAPSLEVEGVGPVALPLLPIQARQLVAAAEPAPYGRGEETLIDPSERRCRQIGPDRVRIGGRHWARSLGAILARAAEGLGVDAPIEAEFYKLLLYDQGGFFVEHRDTEKASGMFATLVVVLPSAFAGGELVVRHKGREARLDLRCEDPAEAAFAAFYAGCVHEILPVTEGCRLALVYNLVRRRGESHLPEPPDHGREQARLAALLRSWRGGKDRSEDETPEKLVWPLEHAYTPAELGFAALKGADAAAAGVLAAARQAGCDLHLALLTIEESGAADYTGSYGSRWGRDEDEEEFEAGEVFDRSVTLSHWRRLDGGPTALGDIPVEEGEVSPPDAFEELEPDDEHFREATGNEGASFERTYRRAALVLWPSDRFFAVLSQAGLPATLPWLDDLTRRWAESGGDGQSPQWREAHDLAGHMIAHWPTEVWYPREEKGPSEATRMLALLTRLDDAAAIERFLTEVVAAGRHEKGDNGAILAALDRLPPTRVAALIERILAGTADTAFAAGANLLTRVAAAWRADRVPDLAGPATRLVHALPGDRTRAAPDASWRSAPSVEAGVVVDLLTGLGAIDPALAGGAVDHILASPRTYGLDAVLVPASRMLLAGAGTTRGLAAVGRLRDACIARLRARAAEPLAPPADWRRASELRCRCGRCAELARFLADPGQRSWIFKAVEADRGHIEDSIRQARCDLDTTTDHRPPRPALQLGLHQEPGQLREAGQAARARSRGPCQAGRPAGRIRGVVLKAPALPATSTAQA